MIFCESATQSINLSHSPLKFLSFKGFSWSGTQLPLKIHTLGDLFSVHVRLVSSNGDVLKAEWKKNFLYAPFEMGKIYHLDLRLEYCLPLHTQVFETDFESIHPKSYTSALDFSRSNFQEGEDRLIVNLGEESLNCSTGQPFSRRLSEDYLLETLIEGDMVSCLVGGEKMEPFEHEFFPSFSFIPANFN